LKAFAIGLFVGAFFSALLREPLLDALRKPVAMAENYRGERIPALSGLLFVFALLASLPLMAVLAVDPLPLFQFSGAVSAMALVGLVDDVLGGKGPRGWRGHLGALGEGHITSGILKALAGGLLGLGLAVSRPSSPAFWALDAVGFALFTNAPNLLDVRPGRALKGFFLAYLGLLAWQGPWSLSFSAPLLGGLLVYAGQDLRGRVMMGDVGSNALGAALGFIFVMGPPAGKPWVVLFLLLYHYLAERHSLSRLIEGLPLLRWADGLGTRGRKGIDEASEE
jgi:UDP-N-acetylmuramyl pentapeptide phosphotransferase/UDP-N-acetylglucosamine-1-phosphate transferase